jgi:hypothetical protein
VPGDPLTRNGAVCRALLPYSQLTSAANPGAPVDDAASALPAAAAPPKYTFEGPLQLVAPGSAGGFKSIKNCSGCGKHLPPVSIDLVQNSSHQGLRVAGYPHSEAFPGVTGLTWIGAAPYLKGNADPVRRFVRAMTKSVQYCAGHPVEVRAEAGTFTKIPAAALPKVRLPLFSPCLDQA